MESSKELALSLAGLFTSIRQSPLYRTANLRLDTVTLMHACEAYQADLDRHAVFHGIDCPDGHKRAAFLFKWICKFRPVGFISPTGVPPEALLYVNAWFALAAALGNLNVDSTALRKSTLVPYIVYSGTYRPITPEAWAIIFCLLELQFCKRGQ